MTLIDLRLRYASERDHSLDTVNRKARNRDGDYVRWLENKVIDGANRDGDYVRWLENKVIDGANKEK